MLGLNVIRYPAKPINQAKKLAIKEHLSYKEIGRRLNIPDSTISIWCRDVEGNNPRKYPKTSKKIREKIEKLEKGVFKDLQINRILAKVFCGILYGCEGSKYPASNCIIFTNSDPELIVSFVNLLRSSYKLDESKWRVHLQIHSN